MNRRMPAVLSLLLLVGIVLILPGRVTGDAQFQEPTAVIDPALLETLQTQTEADVLISLKPPGIPFEEQTTEVSRQNTAERQARVLSVLTESDFTLIHQFDIVPVLHGLIAESGVEKLASHPDVVGISINFKVFIDARELETVQP